jgi:hypothetical protein
MVSADENVFLPGRDDATVGQAGDDLDIPSKLGRGRTVRKDRLERPAVGL